MSEIVFEAFGEVTETFSNVSIKLPVLKVRATTDATGDTVAFCELPALLAGAAPTIDVALRLPEIVLRALSGVDATAPHAFCVLPEPTASGSMVGVLPSAVVGYSVLPRWQVSADIHMTYVVNAEVVLPALSAFAAEGDTYAKCVLPRIDANGFSTPFPESYISVFQSPGYAFLSSGQPVYRGTLSETISLDHASMAHQIWALRDRLDLDVESSTLLECLSTSTGSLALVDTLGAIYKVLAQEGFDLALDSNESMSFVMQLIESLGLLGEPGSMLEATSLVTQALALRDMLEVLAREQLTDQAAFSAAFSNALTARQQVIEAATLALTANGSVVVTLIAEESMALAATPASVLEGLNTIHEGISFALTIRLGDTVYAAWVCNTETKAFSNYENYPFNSFFELDGRYYGVADTGVYLLEGNTDDGDAIAWRIRTGLWNLGTGKMKNVPSMYLGYRSSGDMVLKVVTTTIGGDKEQNWYQLKPVSTNNVTHEGRINLGRGLRSVYWGFELEGINGADFALETLQLFPVILDRRITGGSNGT